MSLTANQRSSAESELSAEAESLWSLANELSSCVGRVRAVVEQHTVSETDQEQESSLLVAQQLHDERLRLIEGWAALESEQRRQLLSDAPATKQSGVAPKQVARAAPPTRATMDRTQQFRFLQRECDRRRDK